MDSAPSLGQDGAKPCRPKPPAAGASAKRQCLEQRSIPKGMVRKAAPLDGNCLFHAASMAIAAANLTDCRDVGLEISTRSAIRHFMVASLSVAIKVAL